MHNNPREPRATRAARARSMSNTRRSASAASAAPESSAPRATRDRDACGPSRSPDTHWCRRDCQSRRGTGGALGRRRRQRGWYKSKHSFDIDDGTARSPRLGRGYTAAAATPSGAVEIGHVGRARRSADPTCQSVTRGDR